MSYIVKTKKCLEWRVRRDIKRHRLTNVENIARGIGKTELLVQIARETGALIVCANRQDVAWHKDKYPDVFFIPASESPVTMAYYRCGVLLEEGVPTKVEQDIRRHCSRNIIGGYTGFSGKCRFFARDNKLFDVMTGRERRW